MMSSRRRLFKALFGVLALVGFIWFLLLGVLTTDKLDLLQPIIISGSSSYEHVEVSGRNNNNNFDFRPASNLKYVSKRRVPKGPDPIHNRRAANSDQPPGQA